jgi:adenylate cyclase
MQRAVARLRGELEPEGYPPITLRIGVHSGIAVVGNMGSDHLFDYTAVGDDVNLASRLEGLNKLYGTTLLVSAATTARVAEGFAFRPVDRVRVKGKTESVDVFTVDDDPVLATLSGAAIAAYRERRWEDSELSWKDVIRRRPGDALAGVYLERIAGWRESPPPPDWDGTFTAEWK